MQRKKNIAILAHCVLNVNSKVEGLANYQGAMKSLVTDYINEGCGIIQLPCPEITFCGLQRWGMSRNQYDNPNYRRHCRKILTPIVEQVKMYVVTGYSIKEIVCVNGSPSCGLDYSFEGYRGGLVDSSAADPSLIEKKNTKGIFIEELDKMLAELEVTVKFAAFDEKSASA